MLILDKSKTINKFLEHATSDSMIKFYGANAGESLFLSLPICPKCERLGLRDKGWATQSIMKCPYCGYHGTTRYQLSSYMKDEGYK